MGILKRWTGSEWEVLGLGVNADVNEVEAIRTINDKSGASVVLDAGDIPYSATSSNYPSDTTGKTLQTLTNITTPYIANASTTLSQILSAINAGKTVYADIDNYRHHLLYKGMIGTNNPGVQFTALTNGSINTVTYTGSGMTQTNTVIGNSNFWATSGETTFEEIHTAILNDKAVKCYLADLIYDLRYIDVSQQLAIFTCITVENNIPIIYWIQNQNTDWTTPSSISLARIANSLPNAPTTNGTYILKATIASGIPTYSWVAES